MNLSPVFWTCAAVSWLLKYMTLADIPMKLKKIQYVKANPWVLPLKSVVAGASVQFSLLQCSLLAIQNMTLVDTGQAQLIQSHSLARISFKLSGNSN